MSGRVRIYELAKQMNIPPGDVINTFRELGYDVKSHSSTVDDSAVGMFIQAYGKKKNQDKVTKTTATTAAPAKTATKTASKPAAPAAPVVKPRVLSRSGPRPVAPNPDEVAAAAAAATTDAATVAAQTTEQTAQAAPAQVSTQTAQPAATAPDQQAAPTMEPAQTAAQTGTAAPAANSGAATAAANPGKSAPPVVHQAQAAPDAPATEFAAQAAGVATQAETSQPEKEADLSPEAETAARQGKDQKGKQESEQKEEQKSFEPKSDDDKGPEIFGAQQGQAVRPMTPSVPVRVAAPSVRATPPRPPKTHRQTPSERHGQKKEERSRPAAAVVDVPKVITLTQGLQVKELAEKMGVPDTEVIKRLLMRGIPRTVNQIVELDLARDLATEMEYEIITKDEQPEEEAAAEKPELTAEEQASLVTRPPVVTIMGHVDHGKTSLLDAIRQAKFQLTDAEAGGITQHIGAYHVEVEGEDGQTRQIVFLDTPGHEAFTAMRARGAKATDVAILVVAADDGVMPQTIEAIDHVKAAGVPIIVAVNKIDKSHADPDRVLTQLMEHELLPDKFGGDTVTVNVSAKKRTGLDELLEMILLVADMQDLKANPDKPATGVIIEAEKSRTKGAVATALVENGTLREGDFIVAGNSSGRVRALLDDRGQRVKAAGPSMPVEVLGLEEVPQAGDRFEVVADAQAARNIVEQRKLADRRSSHVTLESLHDMLATGDVKDLNVIVKADVQGTAEAIAEQVKKLSGQEVQVRVLRTASGDISENDVNLAASSNAIIIGFNVNPDPNARSVAESEGVDIRTYNIIYQITDDLEKAIQGLITPIKQEVQLGTAEVRQIFKFGKNLMIAGCMVTGGKVQRGCNVRITRGKETIYEGKLDTLKRFKDDAKEVAQGFECGMSFEKFSDLQEGDVVNCSTIQEVKREAK